ncbi:MAG: Asp-tRNA(Asn)/Glu-tRNA(Gln) amidotransferase subunit GatC [Armatimonadetes bacterium]|nr:Asp-tRNA(Asn)/Glu-tRNA(Gln) amidotransferase subunit GatC [Armatimonadota bacterium]
MALITREEVLHVANLARLALTEDEVNRLQYELGRILEYFQQLQELDTSGVPITSHVLPMVNVFRQDAPGESLPQEDVLANAPDQVEGFFRVPRIIEE